MCVFERDASLICSVWRQGGPSCSKMLNNVLLVTVDMVQAILKSDYFVDAVKQCETNLTLLGRHRLLSLVNRTYVSTDLNTSTAA